MGVFSGQISPSGAGREVRIERMRPAQVDEAKQGRAAIYVPFGSLEWHGYHNPVGLDALKAHEQLVGLALQAGGVVYPPVFWGSGGGHLDWPHTFMVEAEPMTRLVTQLLFGFEKDGYRQAILLSGHYPNRSQYLDAAIQNYLAGEGGQRSTQPMKVLALVENQIPAGKGDHAALYETSFMLYLHPDTVDAAALRLPEGAAASDPTQVVNWMGAEWKGHPCYGLVGIDPRQHANPGLGAQMTTDLITYLKQWLEEA